MNGLISTVAGNRSTGFSDDSGAAANALLSGPLGVAVDSKGDLYIADWGHSRVLKVSERAFTPVAGPGEPNTHSGRN